jgi:uncharacterized protein YbjT (DUF2867 family)
MSASNAQPQTIAIFGAASHIGGPLARFVQYRAPDIRLRLISRSSQHAESLRHGFPRAEIAVADYLDPGSLDGALTEAQAVFVITPHFLDEERAMGNLVTSLRKVARPRQIIRIVGFQPDSRLSAVPKPLRDFGSGVATQHFVARDVLDASGLPVTYLNMGASLMDNFLRNTTLRTERVLVWPGRMIPYLDPREVGEAAARLFLSGDPGHLGRVFTINNGHDLLRASEVATIMSDVLQEPIRHDGSKQSFMAKNDARMEQRFGRKGGAEYLWNYLEHEGHVELGWSLNDCLERMLGRKPTTLRAWLQEHRDQLFGPRA